MRPSESCYAIIKRRESFADVAYLCPAGKWTIGYGHTGDVKRGDICTPQKAQMLLEADAATAARFINEHVEVPLTQNQFDALVSLVFNIGTGNFLKSTMLSLLNMRLYDKAADEFKKWCHANGKVLAGLVARRAEEEALFRA